MEHLVIVGSGPAGISASLYTIRAGLSTLVVANGMGGLEKAGKIDNFYSNEEGFNGAELHEKGIRQAKNWESVFWKQKYLAYEKKRILF